MATPPIFTAGQVLTAAQMNAVGQWVVTPKTTFTAVASVGASGVFTSDFDDYLLVVRATTSSTGSGGFQLTLASTPATSLYSRQTLSTNDTTVAAVRQTAQANFLGVPQTTNGAFAGYNMLYISKPALAVPTVFNMTATFSAGDFTTIRSSYIVGMHETATAYDGWAINMPAGQTTTGDYILYGLNK